MLARLEAAGGAAVAQQRLGRVVECALHLRVEFLVLELFRAQPLRCGDE